MNRVYKVNHLVDDKIKQIYVFYGKKRDSQESEETLFAQIFSEQELQRIRLDNIPIQFLEQSIHYDDSIGVIKIKILNEFTYTKSIYFYSLFFYFWYLERSVRKEFFALMNTSCIP
jgi:hypothetical protein